MNTTYASNHARSLANTKLAGRLRNMCESSRQIVDIVYFVEILLFAGFPESTITVCQKQQ